MSMVTAGAGGAVAAAAAAQQQAKMREEEEKLTTYKAEEMNGWEFKIVRSNSKIRGDKFKQLIDEESRHGWELVEKFDDTRVRFKRTIDNRSKDTYASDTDPYRTTFGLSDTRLVLMILAVVIAVTATIVTVAILSGR